MTDESTPARGARARAAWSRVGTVAWQVGVPVVIALIVGALALAFTGTNPIEIYGMLVQEAFGGANRIDATLAAATPLIFTGLAAAFAYRAGIFTVGVEGSFAFAGLTAAVIGTSVGGMPAPLAISFSLLAGMVAGGLVALIPALLRAYFAVDEVVTTLMLNFIVVGVAAWLVQAYFLAPGQANSATAYIAGSAELPALNPPNQANAGLIIAVILVVAYAIWSKRSQLGFEFQAVGNAPRFAVAQGLRSRMVIITALVGAGVIGGLGGAAHTLGVVGRYSAGFSADFGFTGIAIALLARFHPVGIVIGAIAFGALNAAGATVQLFVNIPLQLIDILQGTVMMLAVAQFAIPRLRARAKRADAPSALTRDREGVIA